jgi:hypothetical protein
MQTNEVPLLDPSDNPTGCCPRFHPEPWEGQMLRFEAKPFVRKTTRSLFHVPLNMGKIFSSAFAELEQADALDEERCFVLSHDASAWSAEHLFAVPHDVPGEDVVHLTGDFYTKVFEGPFKDASEWIRETRQAVEAMGRTVEKTYLFYTTCPKCGKEYGKNFVVAFAQLHDDLKDAAAHLRGVRH